MYVPACLPGPRTDYTGSDVWVLGWGRTQEGGEVSDTLQELEIRVVEDQRCLEAMSGQTFPGEQLCGEEAAMAMAREIRLVTAAAHTSGTSSVARNSPATQAPYGA